MTIFNDVENKFMKHLLKHVACLKCTHNWQINGIPTSAQDNASGFLVSIQGRNFFITAAHVITAIKNNIRDGHEYISWALDDTAGTDQEIAIPIEIIIDQFILIEHNDSQNFAMYELDINCVNLIQINNKIFLSEISWDIPDQLNYEHYLMIGTPEAALVRNEGNVIVYAQEILLQLEYPIVLPDSIQDDGTSLYARIMADLGTPEAPLINIRGMSGCPIFGYNVEYIEGIINFDYKVVALQSAWYRAPQIIRTCKIRDFLVGN